MNTQYDLVQAILLIRPNAEFAIRDMQIEWLDEKQTQPTEQEIAQALIDYKAKLAALGLTSDDLKALGLVGN